MFSNTKAKQQAKKTRPNLFTAFAFRVITDKISVYEDRLVKKIFIQGKFIAKSVIRMMSLYKP